LKHNVKTCFCLRSLITSLQISCFSTEAFFEKMQCQCNDYANGNTNMLVSIHNFSISSFCSLITCPCSPRYHYHFYCIWRKKMCVWITLFYIPLCGFLSIPHRMELFSSSLFCCVLVAGNNFLKYSNLYNYCQVSNIISQQLAMRSSMQIFQTLIFW
jgi:hypothetical protein